MYDVPEKTYRVIEVLGPGGLDEIATEVYGRKYSGVGDGDHNGTAYEVDATVETLAQYSVEEMNDVDNEETIAHWLAQPEVEWDFHPPEDYWIPGPIEAIPDLVFKGHLPHGVYLVCVSW